MHVYVDIAIMEKQCDGSMTAFQNCLVKCEGSMNPHFSELPSYFPEYQFLVAFKTLVEKRSLKTGNKHELMPSSDRLKQYH